MSYRYQLWSQWRGCQCSADWCMMHNPALSRVCTSEERRQLETQWTSRVFSVICWCVILHPVTGAGHFKHGHNAATRAAVSSQNLDRSTAVSACVETFSSTGWLSATVSCCVACSSFARMAQAISSVILFIISILNRTDSWGLSADGT